MSAQTKEYLCQKVTSPPALDGFVTGPVWDELPWTNDFVDITGLPDKRPWFKTQAKLGWDKSFLYVGATMEEPHVWGTITQKNSKIFADNDFEIFIDPDCDGLNYYEFEINALGTIWELSLPKPYKDGGQPVSGCNIKDLISAVGINGTLNNPGDRDQGWSVTVAMPWSGLKRYHKDGAVPPALNDVWRMNFSRVQWEHKIEHGRYVRVPAHDSEVIESLNPEEQAHPEENWVWSPQGEINMHLPGRWGRIKFCSG